MLPTFVTPLHADNVEHDHVPGDVLAYTRTPAPVTRGDLNNEDVVGDHFPNNFPFGGGDFRACVRAQVHMFDEVSKQ